MIAQAVNRPPTARPDITLRRVGSEWVLYDAGRQRAHVLNLAAAVVWTYCDGAHGADAIAAALARAVPETAPERLQRDIAQALRRFADEGLLQ